MPRATQEDVELGECYVCGKDGGRPVSSKRELFRHKDCNGLAVCYVCRGEIRDHNFLSTKVREATALILSSVLQLARHKDCEAGSPNWMNSKVSESSEMKSMYERLAVAKNEEDKRMAKKEVLREDLVTLAEEMNKVMALDPPLEAGADDSFDKLLATIKEEAEHETDGLRATDEFSDKAKGLFHKLGVKTPAEWSKPPVETKETKAASKNLEKKEESEKKEEPEKKEKPEMAKKTAKKTTEKKTAKKAAAPAATKKTKKEAGYVREHSICDALTKSKQTIDQVASEANKLYVKHGGKSNVKQSKHVLLIGLRYLVHTGYATMDDDGNVRKA